MTFRLDALPYPASAIPPAHDAAAVAGGPAQVAAASLPDAPLRAPQQQDPMRPLAIRRREPSDDGQEVSAKLRKMDSKVAAREMEPARAHEGFAPAVSACSRAAACHFRPLRRLVLSIEERAESKAAHREDERRHRTFVEFWLRSHATGDSKSLISAIHGKVSSEMLAKPYFLDVLCSDIVSRAGDDPARIAEVAAALGARLLKAAEPGSPDLQPLVSAVSSVRLASLYRYQRGDGFDAGGGDERQRLLAADAQGAVHALAMLDGIFSGLGGEKMQPATRRALLQRVFALPEFAVAGPVAGHLIARLGGSLMAPDVWREVVDAIVAAPGDKGPSHTSEEELGRSIVFGLGNEQAPPQSLVPYLDALKAAGASHKRVAGIICGMISGLGGSRIADAHLDPLMTWVQANASGLTTEDFTDLVDRMAYALACTHDRFDEHLRLDHLRRVIDLFFCERKNADKEPDPRTFAFQLLVIADADEITECIQSNPLISPSQRESIEQALEDGDVDDDDDEGADDDGSCKPLV